MSCPACGGAIHPIAGRCKHCKVDLVTVRGGATAAIGSVELTAPTDVDRLRGSFKIQHTIADMTIWERSM